MKKIPTLFERVFDNHKIVDVLPNIQVGCEDAFFNGIATVKWDGACCAIINGELYKRYDSKKGKKVPEGAIKCQEEADLITGHLPCWVKCDESNPADKWFFAALEYYKNTESIEAGSTETVPFIRVKTVIIDGTYEAVGKHFQGNPYGLNYDTIIRHGVDYVKVDRNFNAIRHYLENNKIEGIVFWKDGEPKCKIKRSDFGFEWGK